ncbi:50S ribosomal protein L4 [Candidatus Gracilibacteria bacterium HOT-871]|nr:50S ribosomal protein L4 [Candidatus Gracilibacteria bacterium HOT-871]MBB1565310.1 50S ribosomal protein L4 [Candidatus Gracilibacteria bacterium]RKW22291.1 MAG: 50S ribosomal protein L4 [Candidatus Gracilibacteria bacterium]
MNTNLFDQNGKVVGEIELNASIFGLELNEGLVHRALIYQLANNRTNISHTKTRGERRGSTRKIYRQKGTGRARMGSNRSPVRKKGGVAFGPRNTVNFEITMNKKERRKALFCVLSSKFANKQLVLVDKIEFDTIKTKNMVQVLNSLPYEKNALLAIPAKNEVIEKSSSNLPYVKTILVNYLNVKDLLKYKTLILLKDSLVNLENLVK